jgi:hypothetical protein
MNQVRDLDIEGAVHAPTGRAAGREGKAGEAVEDTWGTRELPVLSATVALLEDSYMVTVSDIAERTGLDLSAVARSLEAMDPTYVDFRKTTTGGDPRFWYVNKVTPAAREEVGQWPAPAKLIDRLSTAFGEAAAHEPDPLRRDQLRHASVLLSGPVRDVAVQVAAQVMARSAWIS